MTGFENQLNTEQERDAFFLLEVNSRSAKTIEQLSKVFDDVAKQKPFVIELSWFEPLKKATIEHHNSSDAKYLSVRSYVRSIESQFFSQIRRGEEGLSLFTVAELSAPHMVWVSVLDRKCKEYQKQFPSIRPTTCAAMARFSTLGDLTNDELYKLRMDYTDDAEGFYSCMDFYQYVEWYEESKKMFNRKGELIGRISKEILDFMSKNKALSTTDIESTLQKSYEIHPCHNEQFQAEIIKFKEAKVEFGEIVSENAQNINLDDVTPIRAETKEIIGLNDIVINNTEPLH